MRASYHVDRQIYVMQYAQMWPCRLQLADATVLRIQFNIDEGRTKSSRLIHRTLIRILKISRLHDDAVRAVRAVQVGTYHRDITCLVTSCRYESTYLICSYHRGSYEGT